MKKAVIFDMDGTLWDSVDEIVESWNKTCPEMHIRREQLIGLMEKPWTVLQGNFSRNMRWIRRWRSFMPVSGMKMNT